MLRKFAHIALCVALASGFFSLLHQQWGVAGGVLAQAVDTPGSASIGIITASKMPDGSLMHVVAAGETLWGISQAYQVRIDDLARLNGLDVNAGIWPGDRLLIQAAPTATTTPEPTATIPTQTPSPTATQTRAPPTSTATLHDTVMPTSTAFLQGFTLKNRQSAAVAMIVLSAVGILLVVLGALRRK